MYPWNISHCGIKFNLSQTKMLHGHHSFHFPSMKIILYALCVITPIKVFIKNPQNVLFYSVSDDTETASPYSTCSHAEVMRIYCSCISPCCVLVLSAWFRSRRVVYGWHKSISSTSRILTYITPRLKVTLQFEAYLHACPAVMHVLWTFNHFQNINLTETTIKISK